MYLQQSVITNLDNKHAISVTGFNAFITDRRKIRSLGWPFVRHLKNFYSISYELH